VAVVRAVLCWDLPSCRDIVGEGKAPKEENPKDMAAGQLSLGSVVAVTASLLLEQAHREVLPPFDDDHLLLAGIYCLSPHR
jgi:hypothetical protein